MVEGLRPRIERVVDGLIDEMVAKQQADIIDDFAYPLPVIVICEMFGVPLDDQSEFHEWAPAIAARFEVPPFRTAEDERLGDIATEHFCAYMDGLIEAKRTTPGDDLLSSLVAAEDGGDRL